MRFPNLNTEIVLFLRQYLGQIRQNRGLFSTCLFKIFHAKLAKNCWRFRSNFWYEYLIGIYTTFSALFFLIFKKSEKSTYPNTHAPINNNNNNKNNNFNQLVRDSQIKSEW